MKFEVVNIPVADVERSKEFYTRLGWRLDKTPPGVVQFTPPGSGCSVQFGTVGRTKAAPGSAQGMFLAVSDLQATREKLLAAGVAVGEISHPEKGHQEPGPDPEHHSYHSLAQLVDPDGNIWWLQEVTSRLPGRLDPGAGTAFTSVADLAAALRRAEAAHKEHEERTGSADPNWPDWYATYLAHEESGQDLPS
ncbi:VOC family protein [Streptomyces sp. NPDC006012]|uniref:VOC family protein n=1 Tax=Streptomyces sp. NPDC006012 TaxID=3364739 RepID=UPI0036B0B9FE